MPITSRHSLERLVRLGIALEAAEQILAGSGGADPPCSGRPGPTGRPANADASRGRGQSSEDGNETNDWWAVIEDRECGPHAGADLVAMLRAGRIGLDTEVWHASLGAWTRLGSLPALRRLVVLTRARLVP